MYRLKNSDGTIDYPVVIDGRTNVNAPEIWQAFMAALGGKESWRELIDLTKPETILWDGNTPFSSLLIESGEWCRLQVPGKQTGIDLFVKRDYFLTNTEKFKSDNCATD